MIHPMAKPDTRDPSPSQAPCPCGSGRRLAACGAPVLAGAPAPSAEALMRSRYSAHVLGDADYLARSRCPQSQAAGGDAAADAALDASIRWLDLRILRTEGGGASDTEGVVEFIARYKQHGRAERLHEVSRFRRSGEGWCYLDGVPGGAEPDRGTGARRRR
jgi:SEC-C motif domain protein